MYKHVCTLELIYKLSSSAWLLMAAISPMPRIAGELWAESFCNACRRGTHLETVTPPMQE